MRGDPRPSKTRILISLAAAAITLAVIIVCVGLIVVTVLRP
jgi:hypothetical protein